MFRGPADVYDRFVGRYGGGPRGRADRTPPVCSRAGVCSTSAAGPARSPQSLAELPRRRPRRRGRAVRVFRRGLPEPRSRRGSSASPQRSRSRSRTTPSTPRSRSSSSTSWTDAPQGLAEMRRVTRSRRRRRGLRLGLRRRDDACSAPSGTRPRRSTLRRPPERTRPCASAAPTSSASSGAAPGSRTSRSSPLMVEASYDDFDDLWAPFPTGVGPGRRVRGGLERRGPRGAPRRVPAPARRSRRPVHPLRPRLVRRRAAWLRLPSSSTSVPGTRCARRPSRSGTPGRSPAPSGHARSRRPPTSRPGLAQAASSARAARPRTTRTSGRTTAGGSRPSAPPGCRSSRCWSRASTLPSQATSPTSSPRSSACCSRGSSARCGRSARSAACTSAAGATAASTSTGGSSPGRPGCTS